MRLREGVHGQHNQTRFPPEPTRPTRQFPKLRNSVSSCTMAAPDVGRLDLSESDSEDLFASPSRASKPAQKSTKQTEAAPSRKEESKYDVEQAREASLQRELESVRNINNVIEGVVNSLECARGNMDVRKFPSRDVNLACADADLDCFAHSYVGIHALEHLDPYSLTD
jgi:hypothetical protein